MSKERSVGAAWRADCSGIRLPDRAHIGARPSGPKTAQYGTCALGHPHENVHPQAGDGGHLGNVASWSQRLRVRLEPGTLSYEWHYSEENASLVLLESYSDSAAHLRHMQSEGHGEFMGNLMALIYGLDLFVLGEPTAEHREAVSGVPGAQFHEQLASK